MTALSSLARSVMRAELHSWRPIISPIALHQSPLQRAELGGRPARDAFVSGGTDCGKP